MPGSLVSPRTLLHVDMFVAEFCGHLGFSSTNARPLPVPGSLRAVPLKPPPTVYDDGSVRSVASLGAFPEPPSHFPIPPLTRGMSSNSENNFPIVQHSSLTPQGDGPMQSQSSSDKSGSSSGPSIALFRVTESPMEESAATPALTNGSLSQELPQDRLATPALVEKNEISAAAVRLGSNTNETAVAKLMPPLPPPNTEALQDLPPTSVSSPQLLLVSATQPRQQLDPAPPATSRSSSSTGVSSTFRRGDYLDDREFGVSGSTDVAQLKPKTLGSAQDHVERDDTSKSSGSMVALIRDKYTRAVSGYL
jgi:hypothetical protein